MLIMTVWSELFQALVMHDDDQILLFADSRPLLAKLLKNATTCPIPACRME
jgi:hypothetical protein